jgi:phospholipid/cholesterol/gamma-HCH transport system substrate-binding protein
MDERIMQFRIGVMVLGSVIITGTLALLFGPETSISELFQRGGKYTLRVEFDEAPGVRENTPVLKSGIVIGRVTKVELIEQGRRALVTARIEEDRKIYDNEICRINRSLLGDSALEFIKTPGPGLGNVVQLDGKPLQGVVIADPLQVVGNLEGNLAKAIDSVAETSGRLGNFIERIDRVMGSDDEMDNARSKLRDVTDMTLETMQSIEELASHANDLLGDEAVRAQLKDSVRQVPELMAEVRQTVDQMNRTLQSADNNLKNLEGFTDALDEHGASTLEQLDRSAGKLDQVLAEMATFTASLNNPDGTIGQLVNNPELYDSLNRTVRNVEDLTRRLRPIVDDARKISDQIARHPGVIVRDAIKPGDGTKGMPSMISERRYGLR